MSSIDCVSAADVAYDEIAARYHVNRDAVAYIAHKLAAGGGSFIQFDHPELGGLGQWSRGGMLMIGDMFNHALKARVGALIDDVARLEALDSRRPHGLGSDHAHMSAQVSGTITAQWPSELGTPSASGSQNQMRYAFFPHARRLAIAYGDALEIYDTGDHLISGFSQQQSGDQSLAFASQSGPVTLSQLRRIDGVHESSHQRSAPSDSTALQKEANMTISHEFSHDEEAAVASMTTIEDRGADTNRAPHHSPEEVKSEPAPQHAQAAHEPAPTTSSAVKEADPLDLIERLHTFLEKGVLTAEEFSRKKAELLNRL